MVIRYIELYANVNGQGAYFDNTERKLMKKSEPNTENELLPVIQREENALTTQAIDRLIHTKAKRPSDSMLVRAQKVGLEGKDAIRAVELVLVYKSNFHSVVRWREDGMTLDEIAYYLKFKVENDFAMSVPLIRWYVESANFRLPTLANQEMESVEYGAVGAETIIDFFSDICDRIGGSNPAHRIKHIIEEQFGGNVMDAYYLGIENEDELLSRIDRRYFQPTYISSDDREFIDSLRKESERKFSQYGE